MHSYFNRIFVFFAIFLQCVKLDAQEDLCTSNKAVYQVTLDPQWIHATRDREGGVKQSGSLYGAYFTFARLKRYGWYIGVEASYARGSLKGSIEEEGHIHSKFTDYWLEGRFGYTFQQKAGCRISFTPYIGYGYAVEKNNFGSSTPLPLHFKTTFYYPSVGFRSSICPIDQLTVALDVRARIPLAPRCHVSNDPENDNVKQNVGEQVQWRVELPLTYTPCCCASWGISCIPFYEYRPYDERVNFPFDYYKTTITMWGVAVGIKADF